MEPDSILRPPWKRNVDAGKYDHVIRECYLSRAEGHSMNRSLAAISFQPSFSSAATRNSSAFAKKSVVRSVAILTIPCIVESVRVTDPRNVLIAQMSGSS